MIPIKNEDFKPNLYERLHIKRDACYIMVKKAYRKRANETHPDKNPNNPNATKEFVAVSRAYEILSNQHAKAQYDAQLACIQPQQNTSYTAASNDNHQPDTDFTYKKSYKKEHFSQKAKNTSYEDIQYTEEELKKYREAADRLHNKRSRNGDLSTVFNFHAQGKKAPKQSTTPTIVDETHPSTFKRVASKRKKQSLKNKITRKVKLLINI